MAGITLTAIGPLTVVGVCIPWRDAHVRSGRRDRSQWQEHEAWLAGFESLPYRHAKRRTVVLGDFNQRIPRRSQPAAVHAALLDAFEGFSLATAGDLDGTSGRALDHIAHTPDMAAAGASDCGPGRTGMTIVCRIASVYEATSPSEESADRLHEGIEDRRVIGTGSAPDRDVRR